MFDNHLAKAMRFILFVYHRDDLDWDEIIDFMNREENTK